MSRPRIFCCIGAAWPGNDASGPNRSYASMREALSDRFDFHLLSRDRPFGGTEALDADSTSDRTLLAPAWSGAQSLRDAIHTAGPDLIWLNGFFDRDFTIPVLIARKLGRLGDIPVLLSPRGEFAPAALALKAKRKRVWLAVAKTLGLLDGVTLHATAEPEQQAIHAVIGQASTVAPNIRTLPPLVQKPVRETVGAVCLAFVGRISRMKNLDFALRALALAKMPAVLDIYGPIEDDAYWGECRALIASLPSHVSARHHGELPASAIALCLAEADMLFLPTRGENFGHAIFEALAGGTPVLISDRTPWRDLPKRLAGWDLPLDDPARFARAIDLYAALKLSQRNRLTSGARQLAADWEAQSDAAAATIGLIETALAR